ncbi:MAG: TonB-dependent receptor plug domain-containing protein [Flavobacteriia bacterium]|nr:TonB-dependent receptor plug domain-containing protein [Flavobacteriia bacterium]
MKKALLIFSILLCSPLFSQDLIKVSGVVKDKETNELIVSAQIRFDSTQMVLTDLEGNYMISLKGNMNYSVKVSNVGYEDLEFTFKTNNLDVIKNIILIPLEKAIEEVKITADYAKTRETPIAFSKLSSKQIAEELGTRDLPMILNSTPGAYATEQGGGAGDARVSIRGFSQQNIAVLVDGVPVNDMENGQVYWSNWDGLSDVTRMMQVQRGLGASKLSIVSVGGTMNIITKSMDQKLSASVKQEVNNYGLYKTSFGFNTGMLKGRWGITIGGSRKWGGSYANATFDDAWSYFFKIQKRFNKSTLTFGVNGAPQSHGQRTTRLPIAVIDKDLAGLSGVNYAQSLDSLSLISNSQFTTPTIGARGIRYNPNYGILNGSIYNEKINYFHKPQFNLTYSWNPNSKFNWTNIVYASVGKGGGTAMKSTPARDTITGLYDFQEIYNFNSQNFSSVYSTTEHISSNYLRAANNDHKWVGLLSTLNYKMNSNFSMMFGLDARYYKGSHYQTVYDLIGGDYATDNTNKNQPKGAGNTEYAIKRVGDKVSFNYDSFVSWLGFFGQIEYKKNAWSAFMTSSISETGYQRVDYFKKKDLILSDTSMNQSVGYGDTIIHNGISYTNNSSEARYSTTAQKWFLGSTIKGGANYNINKNHNVFVNMGLLNIAPKMNLVFDNNNQEFLNVKNQKVTSIELGYGYKSKRFSSNVNVYYTLWKNKPPQNTPSVVTPDGTFSYNINGMNALHKGIELDFIYKVTPKIDLEGLASIGDWKTISGSTVNILDNDGQIVTTVDFSAKNVHVGDAAQIQYGGSVRYELIKNLYFKVRYTYFTKNYANFDPLTLTGVNKDHESWKMPSYGLLDINFGYEKKISKYILTFNGGIMNVLNSIYITDAQNGASFNGATSTVFVGMGRRFNIGMKIGF